MFEILHAHKSGVGNFNKAAYRLRTLSFCFSETSLLSAITLAAFLAAFSFSAARFLLRMRASATFLISFVPVFWKRLLI
jgi:hypothetical protein